MADTTTGASSGSTTQNTTSTTGGAADPAKVAGADPAAAAVAAGGAAGGTDPAKTIATGADPAKATTPGTFPDTWRKELAGDDAKVLSRLERFGSPKDLLQSYLEAEKKLTSGQLKAVLPKDATPEQLAEYRKQVGVPESADKYDLTLSDGLVLGEADKPIVDDYLKYAHENNLPNDVVKANLSWYLPMAKAREAQQMEADKDFQVNSEEVMRKEWGGDFKTNVNIISGLLETAPPEVADALMTGRTSDGKVIGDDPRMLKLLSGWAREINPVQTVVPNAGSNAPQAIANELAQLTKMSGDERSDYWSKDKGPALQQRMRDLLEAQDRMKSKAK